MADTPDYGANMRLLFSEAKKFGQLKECAEKVQRAILSSNESSLRPLGRTLYRYLDKEREQWEDTVKNQTRQLIETNGNDSFGAMYQNAICGLRTKITELSEYVGEHLDMISKQSQLDRVKMACKIAQEDIAKLAGLQKR